MASRKREIETLRARITKLEQLQEKEAREQKAREDAKQSILNILDAAEISCEAFIRFNYREIRRIISKIEKEEAKPTQPARAATKKKTSKKRRAKAARRKSTIKIPAGNYTNIPGEPDRVFTVNERGPRPKALKAYAEKLGPEKFFKQCRTD